MDLQELITDLLNTSTTYDSITIDRVILALLISFLLNLLIALIYQKTFKGVVYNREFKVSLVLTGLIVTLVLLPISSNIALSLGMLGALSIVRFRTAIKDPKDMVFTFWTIAVGIICGAGLYLVAIIGVPVIAVMLLGIERVHIRGPSPYLMVVHYNSEAEDALQKAVPKYKLRSRTVNDNIIELMGEVKLNDKEVPQMDALMEIKGVKDVSILSYTSDTS